LDDVKAVRKEQSIGAWQFLVTFWRSVLNFILHSWTYLVIREHNIKPIFYLFNMWQALSTLHHVASRFLNNWYSEAFKVYSRQAMV
jgi:hypothetical protein